MDEKRIPDTAETVEKTFTQAELNRILADRLTRDRDRRAAELDEREKALKARELAVIAAEKLAAAGLPKGLAEVLRYDDEAQLDTAIEQLASLRGFKSGNEPKKEIKENRLPETTENPCSAIDAAISDAFKAPKIS